MKGMPVAILAILFAAMPLAAADKPCIGRIVIKGNTDTPDWFILEMVGLKTGDKYQYPMLRLWERDLRLCGRFAVNADKGIRPTVQLLRENDRGPVVDLVITVEELPRNVFVPAGFDAVRIRSVGNAFYYMSYAQGFLGVAAELVQLHVLRPFLDFIGGQTDS